ncbi:MAG: CvpA family protein, partial [Planctomycetota bacterium]
MAAFDLAFIALLLFFAVGGLMRGLVREVFGLIAWVAAIWASVRLADGFVPLVASMTDNPQARWLLASMSVGAIAYLGVILVGRVVSGALGDTLGPVNRMLGLLFGGAKAVVVIGALTFVGLQFGVTKQEWWKQSHL